MDLTLNKRNIAGYSTLVLLFLMMVFQSQLYWIKIILLFIAFICSGKIIHISRPIIVYVVFLCIYGLWGTFIGIIHLNENPFIGITTTLVWPLLALKFINLADDNKSFDAVVKIILFAHCFIVIYDLLYAFSEIYGFYFPKIYNIDIGFSFYETSSRLNFVNLNTLTFTTPFLVMIAFSGNNWGKSKIAQFTILTLTLFLFILSGRRSVMAQLLLIPFGVFLCGNIFTKEKRRILMKSIILLLLIIVISIYYIYINYYELFEGYLNVFLKAFDKSEEPVKFLQHQSLMQYFIESPLIGHGFGMYFYDPGRHIYMNQMELQYQLSLAQTGIIGFSLFVIAHWGLCCYAFHLTKKFKDSFLLAVTFGYLFMLLAHATNPVLCSFDLMVSYFLVLTRINFLHKNAENTLCR